MNLSYLRERVAQTPAGWFGRLRATLGPKKKVAQLSYVELELLSALGKQGCPLCHDLATSDRDYFFWYLHEGYFELASLDALTQSLGFCIVHGAYLARQGLDRHSGLATVHEIAARRLRADYLQTAENALSKPMPTLPPCPACRSNADSERRAGFLLAKLIKAASSADRYARPGMLCVPHLRVVAPYLDVATLERLLARHESAMTEVGTVLMDGGSVRSEASPALKREALHLAVGHDKGLGPLPPREHTTWPGSTPGPVEQLLQELTDTQMCPVCRETSRAWRDWVVWLKAAAERGDVISDALPTCPQHVWAIVHAGGAVLAAQTTVVALKAAFWPVRWALERCRDRTPLSLHQPLMWLTHAIARPSRERNAREVLARPMPCPLCDRLARARDRTLALLFALLEQQGHRNAYECGYGLCMKHFADAQALGPSLEVAAFLAKVQAAKLAVLQWELEEYSRKRAWTARPEVKGSEQTAPQRALARFSGCLDIEAKCVVGSPAAIDITPGATTGR